MATTRLAGNKRSLCAADLDKYALGPGYSELVRNAYRAVVMRIEARIN